MEVVPPAAPGQQQQHQQSPLLLCLSQLNDDVLTSYLLPKLVEQGSAAAVVLTCSQLRALCQASIQHLDLSQQLWDAHNPCHSPDVARQLAAAFPNCTSLKFAWHSSSMANVYHSIGPLLAGLSCLSSVSIDLVSDSESGGTAADVEPVLAHMLTHATGLRCLQLKPNTDWAGYDATWVSLARLVALTRLELDFGDYVYHPCTQQDLRHLTGLTNLLSLKIITPGADWTVVQREGTALKLATQDFPGRLTSLTELRLPLDVLHDISSVSACVRLRDLQLLAVCRIPHLEAEGRSDQWAALGRLSCLTHLHCDVACLDHAKAAPFCGLIKQLTGLRAVGAFKWAPSSALPLLQSLTQVTAVYGCWAEGLAGLVCPHVRKLGKLAFSTPFSAFPNLTSVCFLAASAPCLFELSRCCTGLRRLELTGPDVFKSGMRNHTAAYTSLAQLQHLTHLELAPTTDADLVAFTTAVAAVRNPRLRCLHVRGRVTVYALTQLLNVRGLEELHVCIGNFQHVTVSFNEDAVRTWLVGLAVVPKVSLVVPTAAQMHVVEAAKRWAKANELPLPALLKVCVGACGP